MNGKLPLSGFLFAIASMAVDQASKEGDVMMKGVYFIIGGTLYIATFWLVKEGVIAGLMAKMGR